MNDAQRNLLAKSLADIAKGVFIAAPIARGTGKITPWVGLAVVGGAMGCYVSAEVLQSGLTIVEYAPFSSYLPRLPQEALLCRRLWTSQPL